MWGRGPKAATARRMARPEPAVVAH